MKNNVLSLLLCSTLTASFSVASVESTSTPTLEPESKLLKSFTGAQPLKRQEPRYSVNAARGGGEGWVVMSFVVDVEGNVLEPKIVDSSGVREFERAALGAVKNWKYQPATMDGKPIQQCANKVQLDFYLSDSPQGARRKFKRDYSVLRELVNAQKSDEAEAKFIELKASRDLWNGYENTWYWLMGSQISALKQDSTEEVRRLNRALFSHNSKAYLGEDTWLAFQTRLFQLEANSGDYHAAQQIFKKIEEAEFAKVKAEELRPYVEQMQANIEGPHPLKTQGTLNDNGQWWHTLNRDYFSFASATGGKVESIDIRCDAQHNVFTFDLNSAWKIPESWGQCSVLVQGEPNTQVALIELPPQA